MFSRRLNFILVDTRVCENEEKLSSQWTQFMQLRKEAWKKKKRFRASTGFEPHTNFLHGCFAWRTWLCRQHTTFTHAKMLLALMIFFSLTGRLCTGGKRFDRANVIFDAYFILRGRDTHINFLRLLFMVGMISTLMQEHFLWPLLKSEALQCG